MVINIARLRQFSVGSIIFTALIVAFLVLGILGSLNMFVQQIGPVNEYGYLLLTSNKYYFIDNNYIYSYEISIYVLATSFAMMVIVLGFLIFFNIKNLLVSIEIDKEVQSDLKQLAIINFCTFCIGSVLQLATCDVIIEKYRLMKSYHKEAESNNIE